ncbi:MAG: phage tail tape measure protein [Reichenbachiella sp.]
MAVKQDQVKTTVILDGKQSINELGKLEMEASEYKRALKDIKKNTDQWHATNNKLTEAKGKINLVRKELGLAGMTMRQLTNYQRDLNRQIIHGTTQGTAKYKELNTQLQQVNARIRSQRLEMRGLNTSWKSSTTGLLKMGAAYLSVYQGFRVIGNFINTFRTLQSENSKLAGILRVTTSETKDLQTQQLKLGQTTEFTATQVAKAQTELAKLGQSQRNIIEMTPYVLSGASAMGVDLADAAELVAGQLNAFQLEATEAGRVTDVLAKATQLSAFDFQRLKDSLGIVSPAAKAVNATLEDTVAVMTAAVDANIDASTAGTALRNIYIDLSDKGLTWNVAMEKIRTSQNKLTTANDLFGKRGAVVATVIAENTEKIDENRKALENSAGTAQSFADQQLDNLTGDIKLLTSAWEGFMLSLENGDGIIAKSLRGAIQLTTEAMAALTNIDLVLSSLFESIHTLSDADALRLIDIGMITESGVKVKDILNTLEDVPYDQLSQKAEMYQNRIVKLFQKEGETLEDSEALWDIYFRNREKDYEVVTKAQEAYDFAIKNGVETFDDYESKMGDQFNFIKNGQEKLIEIEKLYKQAIEDRKQVQASQQNSPSANPNAPSTGLTDDQKSQLETLKQTLVSLQNELYLSTQDASQRDIAAIEQKYERLQNLAQQFYDDELMSLTDFEATKRSIAESFEQETAAYFTGKKNENNLDRQEFQEQLRLELMSDQQYELEMINAHYDELLAQARLHGMDLTAINEAKNEAIDASNKKYGNIEVARQHANAIAIGSTIQNIAGIVTSINNLQAEQSEDLMIFSIIMANTGILLNQAVAMSAALAAATNSSVYAGPAAPFIMAANVTAMLGTVMSTMVAIKNVKDQAGSAPVAPSFFYGGDTNSARGLGFGDQHGAYAGYTHFDEFVRPAYLQNDPVTMDAENVIKARMNGYTLDQTAAPGFGSSSSTDSATIKMNTESNLKLASAINVLVERGVIAQLPIESLEQGNRYLQEVEDLRSSGL